MIVLNAEVQALLADCQKDLEGSGRVVVRPSGTEPLIRVWVCGSNALKVENAGNKLLALIEKLRDQ